MVAGFTCVKNFVLPAHDLWEKIFRRPIVADFREDNQAMIWACRTGRNPTMKALNRVHRVSVGWLHELLEKDIYAMTYEKTDKMAADIHTKGFSDPQKWQELTG